MNVTHFKLLKGHQSPIYHIQTIDTNTLLSCDGNGWLLKWNIETEEGTLLAKCNSSIYTFLKVNRHLLIGDTHGNIHCIDYPKNQFNQQIQVSKKEIFAIEYSKTNDLFFITDGEGQLTILNQNLEIKEQIKISTNRLRSISLSKCEQFLFLGGSDGFVYQYSILGSKVIQSYPIHSSSIFTTLYYKNILFSAGRNAKIISFDTESESVTNTIDAHLNTINQLTLSKCEQFLLTVSRDKSLKVWSAKDLQLLKVVNQEKFPNQIQRSINTLTVCQNFIYTAGDDKKIVIWQMN